MGEIIYHNLDAAHKLCPDNLRQYWCWGPRSCGKTFPIIRENLQHYFDTCDEHFEGGEGFGYIRRYKEEIVGAEIEQMFAPHLEFITEMSHGKFNHVSYYRRSLQLTYRNEDGQNVIRSRFRLSKCFALNIWEKAKGPDPFPQNKRTRSFFDEFIAANGNYLEDEPGKLDNTISTINRLRPDPILYAAGNPLCKWCPHFDKLGIDDVDSIKIGTIQKIVLPEKTEIGIVIEYIAPDPTQVKAAEDIHVFSSSSIKSIVNGAWEIADSARLPKGLYNSADRMAMFFLEFHGKVIIGEILIINDVEILHFKPSAFNTPDDKHYFFTNRTDVNRLYIHGFPRFDFTECIMQIWRYNRIYYSDDTTADRVHGWAKSVGLVK